MFVSSIAINRTLSQQVLQEGSRIHTLVAVLITCVSQRIPSTTNTKQVLAHTGHMSTLVNIKSTATSHHCQANTIMTSPVPFAALLIAVA